MAIVCALCATSTAAHPKQFVQHETIVAETHQETVKRHHREWIRRVKPFVYPDGRRWSVPYPIAWCESGGNYFVGPSGAYGLIPPFPQYMSPRQQDITAHRLYNELGESPWAPYESSCMYR